ncbi:flagellar basal body-associated FliL family protein [Kluyvera sp. STS39-E]|uniref:flagellar basal body-associated FliL family protein n=1 Tax=Kluyvera sp. STS39-E TaxID=3234748 RepID=UPI0034C69F7B
MNAKTLSFGLVIALVTAMLAAGMTVVGTHLLRMDEAAGSSFLSGLFTSSSKESVEFVEIKNVVITLKSNTPKERYLLLELNMATNNPEHSRRAQDMIPAVRGATVSLLSDMDYDAVRAMNVNELHSKLMAAYAERFSRLKMDVPFDDIIISKMVFQ